MIKKLIIVLVILTVFIPFEVAAQNKNQVVATKNESTHNKPNVLFIVIDDLNDWVSHLGGHPQSMTPNIDALASRGVTFLNAHTVAPACGPARSAIMSGTRPHNSGVYYNGSDWEKALQGVTLMNEHFITNGYDAIAGGKIYHGSEGYWNEYWKRPNGTKTSKNKNGLGLRHFDWGPINADDDGMPDHHLTNWAIQQMNTEREKPFFLAVGYVKPHLPFFAPKKYFDRFPLEKIQLPAHIKNDQDDLSKKSVKVAIRNGEHAKVVEANQWKKAVQGYLATVAFVDNEIGRLIKGLDESGKANETIVVLWSDHGWNLGEKEHWRKFALWNDTTRVPYIFVVPGVTKAGGQSSVPVDLQSLYPTLTNLVGIPTPEHVEGSNIRPLLENLNTNWEIPALASHGEGSYMVQSLHQRLIRYNNGDKEFYDHRTDQHEWYNLANDKQYHPVIAKMEKWIPTSEAEAAPKATIRLKKREERQKKIYNKIVKKGRHRKQ